MKTYKIKENLANEVLDELGVDANEEMRWTSEQVEEDACNFEMTPEEFVERYLEEVCDDN